MPKDVYSSGLTLPFFNLDNATDGVEENGSLPRGDTVQSDVGTLFGFSFGRLLYNNIVVRFHIHTQLYVQWCTKHFQKCKEM